MRTVETELKDLARNNGELVEGMYDGQTEIIKPVNDDYQQYINYVSERVAELDSEEKRSFDIRIKQMEISRLNAERESIDSKTDLVLAKNNPHILEMKLRIKMHEMGMNNVVPESKTPNVFHTPEPPCEDNIWQDPIVEEVSEDDDLAPETPIIIEKPVSETKIPVSEPVIKQPIIVPGSIVSPPVDKPTISTPKPIIEQPIKIPEPIIEQPIKIPEPIIEQPIKIPEPIPDPPAVEPRPTPKKRGPSKKDEEAKLETARKIAAAKVWITAHPPVNAQSTDEYYNLYKTEHPIRHTRNSIFNGCVTEVTGMKSAKTITIKGQNATNKWYNP